MKYEEKLMAKAKVISDSANRLWRKFDRKTCYGAGGGMGIGLARQLMTKNRNPDATGGLRGRIINMPESAGGSGSGRRQTKTLIACWLRGGRCEVGTPSLCTPHMNTSHPGSWLRCS